MSGSTGVPPAALHGIDLHVVAVLDGGTVEERVVQLATWHSSSGDGAGSEGTLALLYMLLAIVPLMTAGPIQAESTSFRFLHQSRPFSCLHPVHEVWAVAQPRPPESFPLRRHEGMLSIACWTFLWLHPHVSMAHSASAIAASVLLPRLITVARHVSRLTTVEASVSGLPSTSAGQPVPWSRLLGLRAELLILVLELLLLLHEGTHNSQLRYLGNLAPWLRPRPFIGSAHAYPHP